MTLPISLAAAVLGKFLAAWCFTAIALLCTFPMWLTVNYLGEPDNTVILAGYLGSLLMAGGFLAIGGCVSALTKNPGDCVRHQPWYFVFGFIMSGFAMVLGFLSWLGTADHRRRDQLV